MVRDASDDQKLKLLGHVQEDGHLLLRRQVGPAEAAAAHVGKKVGGQDPVSTLMAASISEAQSQAPTIAAQG